MPMENIKTHFCFGSGSHNDDCDCTCDVCIKRNEDIRREKFNIRLSHQISNMMVNDYEFRLLLLKELIKNK